MSIFHGSGQPLDDWSSTLTEAAEGVAHPGPTAGQLDDLLVAVLTEDLDRLTHRTEEGLDA